MDCFLYSSLIISLVNENLDLGDVILAIFCYTFPVFYAKCIKWYTNNSPNVISSITVTSLFSYLGVIYFLKKSKSSSIINNISIQLLNINIMFLYSSIFINCLVILSAKLINIMIPLYLRDYEEDLNMLYERFINLSNSVKNFTIEIKSEHFTVFSYPKISINELNVLYPLRCVFLNNISEFYNTECPICLENINKYKLHRVLNCGHCFHDDCLYDFIKHVDNNKCPYCLVQIIPNKYCTPWKIYSHFFPSN